MANVAAEDLLLGTWDLVSFASQLPDGSVTESWGAHPVGRITNVKRDHRDLWRRHERGAR